MIINWYPGHMKKTRELIQANLKMVDVVIELLDARMPISSKNPTIDELIETKKRIVVLNKHDLSDERILNAWIAYYKERGIVAIPINSLNGYGIKKLLSEIKLETAELHEKMKEKGRVPRPTRIMIVGIPNVGKSSLINKLAGKKSAKVGNKPGVTRGKQWIKINKDLELFDTPGILWPKIDDQQVGMRLAFAGSIKDDILDVDTLGLRLIEYMMDKYPDKLMERYKLSELDDDGVVVMEVIGRKRGCIMSGNQIDYSKVARLVLDEFRKGTIGRISLESPEDLDVQESVE